MTSPAGNDRPNPYVGPRAFKASEKLYGRDKETGQLLNLLIAERIVLFYSPSGAGKTSLLQAALLPRLRARRFHVWPTVRVNLEAPAEVRSQPGFNRYVFSALTCLDNGLPEDQQLPEAELAGLVLPDYFARRTTPDSQAIGALVFDQFEEILTLDPTDQAAKAEFFAQVGACLDDRHRWALFAMREDYVAGLDPFLRPIPTRFANTFRLDLLGEQAAREAIQKPAREAGVLFTDEAARRLVDDLRQVQVQRPDLSLEPRPGPYVEPVQLQVVCYRLWAGLAPDQTLVEEADLARVGDVNRSLADYFAERVRAAAEASGTSERSIRAWFDKQLISPQGIRLQVLREPELSAGLANAAIDRLVNAHLVRAEQRRGAVWFELAHDRLVKPVAEDNAAWFHEHLSVLQRQAELWDAAGQADDLLLLGPSLAEAESWALANPQTELTRVEKEFLAKCQAARSAAEARARTAARLRRLTVALGAALVVAVVAVGVAVGFWQQAQGAADTQATANVVLARAAEQEATQAVFSANAAGTAQAAATSAVAGQATALAAEATANGQRATAVAAQQEAQEAYRIAATAQAEAAARLSPEEQADLRSDFRSRLLASYALKALDSDPDLALLLAIEAYRAAPTGEAAGALEQAIARRSTRTAEPASEWNIPAQGKAIYDLAFSPDGRALAWVTPDTMEWWGLRGQAPAVMDRAQARWRSVAFSPDARYVAWAGDSGQVWLVALPAFDRQVALARTSAVRVFSLAFSPAGTLAVGQADGEITLWDAARARYLSTLRGCPGLNVTSVAWSPDGQRLVSASRTGSLCVWEPGTLRLVAETALADLDSKQQASQSLPPIWRVVWDPADEWYALSGGDGALELRSSTTNAVLGEPLGGHTGNIYSLAASPDGSLLASGDELGQVVLWDVSAPAAPRRLTPAPLAVSASPVWSLSWVEADGALLLAAGDDAGQIGVYTISTAAAPTGPLEQVGCQLAGRKALTQAEWQQFLPDEPYRATCGS